ncbi:TPA_asm: truncated cowpox A-type inclusion protein [Vaccinia virus]|nr:TPA_asm: truncated cowpox A-type inclusion protein [Vaccinia virus]DAD53262.1 TPA_asm: truncated cowpox A-type inclusion protein [Vaccinia virus]DAD53749.1 TPA_asm: truncated cowpox A-type inclusion protein [Vaccinia virus]DAD54003.1 TPA_asm: truncated cowpox A-type inclusion protein [Vaccinia virus]
MKILNVPGNQIKMIVTTKESLRDNVLKLLMSKRSWNDISTTVDSRNVKGMGMKC